MPFIAVTDEDVVRFEAAVRGEDHRAETQAFGSADALGEIDGVGSLAAETFRFSITNGIT